MKPIVTLLAIFTSLGVFSQATMNIYENNGSVLSIPLASIDSITYSLGSNGTLATLVTLPVESITSGTAASGGDITNSGGTTVTNRGICWSTSPNPTTANNITSNGNGTGSYAADLTGLQASTTYYVCAYATNSAGTAYGNQQSFTTAPNTSATVTTDSITNITTTSATGGGNITSNGGAAITARGVCWSTSASPTIADSATSDGSGTGNFTSSITGLLAGTTYYVRAYATDSAGTAYGNQLNFTTAPDTIAIVITDSITNITTTSATGGGNITSNSGATITSRGVCWSTSINPTIANTVTTDGSGTGSFSSSLLGLIAGTTYYVRAFATDSLGTTYGNQVSFSTPFPSCGTVNDIDGNVYNTVIIGSQCWMQQNLMTAHYQNGAAIGEVEDSTTWANIYNSDSIEPAWCYYKENAAYNSTYGKLYNWYAINDARNVCPVGWHVPSDSEYTVLDDYLGGASVSGGHMKTVTLWSAPNTGANNSSGFTALPAGYRGYTGYFNSLGAVADFWSSSPNGSGEAGSRNLYYAGSADANVYDIYTDGFSVRCVRN